MSESCSIASLMILNKNGLLLAVHLTKRSLFFAYIDLINSIEFLFSTWTILFCHQISCDEFFVCLLLYLFCFVSFRLLACFFLYFFLVSLFVSLSFVLLCFRLFVVCFRFCLFLLFFCFCCYCFVAAAVVHVVVVVLPCTGIVRFDVHFLLE